MNTKRPILIKDKKNSRPRKVQSSPIYSLKITLIDTEPLIWRKLLIRGDMSLGFLHAAIQVAMGWTNSHLHHFIIGKDMFSDPRMDDQADINQKPTLNEWTATLKKVAQGEKVQFDYEYDFGDSWQHVIEMEELPAHEESMEGFVKCIGGERACPPEDCGGVGGYEEFLKAINDPQHEEHESMKEWVGLPFDAEAFDLNKTNLYLSKLKWPKISEEQLARVLMERDGVDEE